MSLKIWLLTSAVAIAIIWLIMVSGPMPDSRPEEKAVVPKVSVLHVQRKQVSLPLESQGVIGASTHIDLIAEVSGRVTKIAEAFLEGADFAANEAMVWIDKSDYQAAEASAQAALTDAERLLAEERGRARQAKREWRDLGSDEANSLFLRKPQIKAAKSNVLAATAALNNAKLDLEKTEISAPFAATVQRKHVDVGQFVSAGTAVARVFNNATAELRLPLSQRQLASLGAPRGAKVDVFLNRNLSSPRWQGTIVGLESDVDPLTRQRRVVISIPDGFRAEPSLALGQYVEATVYTTAQQPLFKIPRDAIRQPQVLWLLDASDKIRVVPVTVFYSNNEYALVDIDLHDNGDDNNRAIVKQPLEGTIRLVVSNLALSYTGLQVEVERADNR